MSKKLLSILLAVVLVFSMAMPSFAVADGTIPLLPEASGQSEEAPPEEIPPAEPLEQPAEPVEEPTEETPAEVEASKEVFAAPVSSGEVILPEDGLVARWTFDGAEGGVVEDVTGNGHDGEIIRGEPEFVEGRFGQAISFQDGELVSVPSDDVFNAPIDGSFTLSAWVKAPELLGQWQAIIQKGRPDAAGTWWGLWFHSSDKLAFGADTQRDVYGNVAPEDEWVCVTLVQNGTDGTRKIYMDGVLAGTGAAQESVTDWDLVFGGVQAGGTFGGEYYTGLLDEVVFYNRALTGMEARALYLQNADVYTVSGQVLPGETGASVEGLTVHLYDAENDKTELAFAVTDADGYYEIGSVTDGAYVARVDAVEGSFLASEAAVEVAGGDVSADITLNAEVYRTIAFAVTPADAKVVLRGDNGIVVPEADGSYRVLEGSYRYTVSRAGYVTQRGDVDAVDEDQNLSITLQQVASGPVVLTEEEILDRMKGGWVGEMAGVTWGASTEFRAQGRLLREDEVPTWTPDMINSGFGQDDLYVEVPFLDCMKDNGVNANWKQLGDYFADSQFMLWHANYHGRENLRKGIEAPNSGHYLYNQCCDDIDWQIEADSVGMAALAQPEVAKELSWRVGHVMNYGDGVYGGVFVSTMYAAAFKAQSLDEIIDAGLSAIPEESQFRQVMEDVIAEYEKGSTWQECWQMLEDKWQNDRCPDGLNRPFNIDAKLNSAYILIGLLWGEEDFEQSMKISMMCGQDSDCNPSSVGGILGCYLGLENIPEQWKSGQDWTGRKFSYTDYTMTDCVNVNLDLAREVVKMTGGTIEDGVWTIPENTGDRTMILEQWPLEKNDLPEFTSVTVEADESDATGRTFVFDAEATDEDGIAAYQWFFGDLTFEDGAQQTHTYREDGVYYAYCYTTDAIGNTQVKQVKVLVNAEEEEEKLPLPKLIAHWTFDEIADGKVADATGNGHDGVASGEISLVDGKVGKAAQFGSEIVSIPDAPELNFSAKDNFTLTAWVKAPELKNQWQAIAQKGRATNTVWYGLWMDDKNQVSFGAPNFHSVDAALPAVNEWVHLAAVQKDGVRYLYVNGALVDATVTAVEGRTSGQPFVIGGVGGKLGELFQGQIDDVRLYNYALAAPEVNKLATLSDEVVLREEEILDRMKGGWVGEMAGVTWGASTEFRAQGRLLREDEVPAWNPYMINDGFGQDDLYVEVPFLDCMKDKGVNANWKWLGHYFRDSEFALWHANYYGRENLRDGIEAPDSGHYLYNQCCDDIDWQIEADSVGMMALAQPEIAKELAWRIGHVMNYGDGVYGGVFVASMYAKAFTASSVGEIVEAGLGSIPEGSQFLAVMNDVVAEYENGSTWQECWQMLEDKWQNDRCPDGLNRPYNIDAKLNSAYILIGLLWGEGDFEQSMKISMMCGQDSDCNPSSVGGILGCYYGLENIPDKWKSGQDWNKRTFSYTEYTMTDCVNVNLDLAREVLAMNGGEIVDGAWVIPQPETSKALILEQWPLEENAMPEFVSATAVKDESDPTGRTFIFDAEAADEDGVAAYQWFFGDLTFDDGAQHTHTYQEDGIYNAVCYTTDGIGNTAWKLVKVYVNKTVDDDPDDPDDVVVAPTLLAHWTFDDLSYGVVKDVTGNGHDGATSGDPQFVEGKIGDAISFDGATQFITVPDAPEFKYKWSDSYSLSTWVKVDQNRSAWQGIVQKGRQNNGGFFGLWISNDNRYTYGAPNLFGPKVKEGEWALVTLVQDSKNNARKMYVNGELAAQTTPSGASSDLALSIGGIPGMNEYFKGMLDDVRIYNYPLSQMEIDNLFALNDAVYSISGTVSADSGVTVKGTVVNLYAADDPDTVIASGRVAKDGSFVIPGAADGEYILKIAGNDEHGPAMLNVTVSGAAVSGLEITFGQTVDKSHLLTMIAVIESLSESDFTAASWKPLGEALSTAKAVAENGTATAQEVMEAYLALVAARDGLVFAPRTELLELAVELAREAMENPGLTEESRKALNDVVKEAEALLKDKNADQAAINGMYRKVMQTIVDRVDANLELLRKLIAQAESLTEGQYTPDSWAALQDALANGIAARDDFDATPEEIKAACDALFDALDGLMLNTNKAALKAAIEFAEEVIAADQYENLEQLEEQLAAAKAVYGDTNATQKQVDDAAAALTKAAAAVRLRAIEAKMEKLNASDYTSASWKALANQLAAAKSYLADEKTENAVLIAAVKAADKAFDGLVKRSTSSHSSKGSASPVSRNDYWNEVIEKVGGAEKGGKVNAVVQSGELVPATVLDTLKGKDVTLVLEIGGKEYAIHGQGAMSGYSAAAVYYTEAELIAMADGKAQVPAAGNPETGGEIAAGVAPTLPGTAQAPAENQQQIGGIPAAAEQPEAGFPVWAIALIAVVSLAAAGGAGWMLLKRRR